MNVHPLIIFVLFLAVALLLDTSFFSRRKQFKVRQFGETYEYRVSNSTLSILAACNGFNFIFLGLWVAGIVSVWNPLGLLFLVFLIVSSRQVFRANSQQWSWNTLTKPPIDVSEIDSVSDKGKGFRRPKVNLKNGDVKAVPCPPGALRDAAQRFGIPIAD